jgi:hypothetical protein
MTDHQLADRFEAAILRPTIERPSVKKDLDLGAGGRLLLPDQNGPNPHLAVLGGKDGNLFVVDRDRMGKYHPQTDNVVQTVKLKGNLHAAPAYWNQHGNGRCGWTRTAAMRRLCCRVSFVSRLSSCSSRAWGRFCMPRCS